MNRERILITGGAGFIGSHTADLLLSQNKQVVVIDNLATGKLENVNVAHPNFTFIEGNILDYAQVLELIKACDAVLHLAAIACVPLTIENPINTFQVNTQGFLHIIEAIRQVKRPIRLVYASSAAVYGEANLLPCKEDMPIRGKILSPYALQKVQSEEYANLYQGLYQIPSLALRYFNVYGERQLPDSPYSGVISQFINNYNQSSALTIYGDGLQTRDFIHVKDVARANVLALNSDISGALNIATGVPETLLQLIKYIEVVGQNKALVQFDATRAGDIRSSYAAINQAERGLAFKYRITLSNGIKMFLETMKRRSDAA